MAGLYGNGRAILTLVEPAMVSALDQGRTGGICRGEPGRPACADRSNASTARVLRREAGF